jgi:D-glycero-alpha-D-manno-heptose-7-phosphate kinase
MSTALRVIRSSAPVRICDNGGWTDTWFARRGRVFSIAVEPRVDVELRTTDDVRSPERVVIEAVNYGDRYARVPEDRVWQRHPLIEAAIAHVGVPPGLSCEVSIRSAVPAAASTGTSAAVTVALVGALARLAGRDLTADAAAHTAHQIETDVLGQQSGVQDQLAAAHGGINAIEIDDYPIARVTRLAVSDAVWSELERRLVLIFLGRGHRSSDIHAAVIERLAALPHPSPVLDDLRRAAIAARDAVVAGDLEALGLALQANTEAQARLHPALINADARRIIAIARAHGASGWKVNGAGGEGGSLAILCGAPARPADALLADLAVAAPGCRPIPIRLSRDGLRVSETGPEGPGPW